MDVIDLARYLGALLLVLALVGFAALAARRYGLAGFVQGTASRRLSVVETMMVGPKHKLVLIRRDGAEHLVLLGPQGADVIESGITAGLASTAPDAMEIAGA
ncbi:MAG: flagellar biosynthetic protein FliO [Rhizomicrobium sp.]|jgi:flagellar protein FliO/FliZ